MKLLKNVSGKIQKFKDFFSTFCPKCGTKMEEEYYVPGNTDSIYYLCPKCGHKLNQLDE